jgi:hypothetical protein
VVNIFTFYLYKTKPTVSLQLCLPILVQLYIFPHFSRSENSGPAEGRQGKMAAKSDVNLSRNRTATVKRREPKGKENCIMFCFDLYIFIHHFYLVFTRNQAEPQEAASF